MKYDINLAPPELYKKFLERFAQNQSVQQLEHDIANAKRHL